MDLMLASPASDPSSGNPDWLFARRRWGMIEYTYIGRTLSRLNDQGASA
jgi:hypothetical protein